MHDCVHQVLTVMLGVWKDEPKDIFHSLFIVMVGRSSMKHTKSHCVFCSLIATIVQQHSRYQF